MVSDEAKIYLSWMNAAHDSFPGRKVVVINLDETSIPKAYGRTRGTVMTPSAWPEYNSFDMSEHVSRSKTHCFISYCALVASDPLVSARLPQVLLASRKNMNRALEQHADVMLGVRTHLWVRNSAWATQEVFLEILELLVEALEDYRSFFSFILVFDAARVHLNMDVAQKLLFHGIRIVVVPAKLTWLLQPLDTHVFANFKNNLRRRLQKAAIASDDGQWTDQQWIDAVADCITGMQETVHENSFSRNGMLGDQGNMKAVENEIFSHDFVNSVGRQPPSLEDVSFALGLQTIPWYDQVVGDLQNALDFQAQQRLGEIVRPSMRITLA